jgi:glutamyl/glutaminyl-tRNA synthetase
VKVLSGQCWMQALVSNKLVRGWDDPRLPTLAGMRRRGLTPEGINTLCLELGINRSEGFVQLKRLYHHVRNHLDATSPRALAVLRPLKLVCNLPPRTPSYCSRPQHVASFMTPRRGRGALHNLSVHVCISCMKTGTDQYRSNRIQIFCISGIVRQHAIVAPRLECR